MVEEKFYSIADIAKLTKLTDRTIRNYLSNGTLKGHKVGGQWRFTKDDIKALFSNDKFGDDMKVITEKRIVSYYNDKIEFETNNHCCSIFNITIENKDIRKQFYKEFKEIPEDNNKKEQILFFEDNGKIKIVIMNSLDFSYKVTELIRRYVK